MNVKESKYLLLFLKIIIRSPSFQYIQTCLPWCPIIMARTTGGLLRHSLPVLFALLAAQSHDFVSLFNKTPSRKGSLAKTGIIENLINTP